MSFANMQDYFIKAAGGILAVKGSGLGKSNGKADGKDKHGDVVKLTVFGDSRVYNADYLIKAAGTLSEVLGKLTAEKAALSSFEISTGQDSEPTVKYAAEYINATAVDGHYYAVPDAVVSPAFHAQIIWEAFTLSGADCHLQSANYKAACNVPKGTITGVHLSYDVTNGMLDCSITIRQYGVTEPTVEAGAGWTIITPLSSKDPDSDYTEWTCALQKELAGVHTDPEV